MEIKNVQLIQIQWEGPFTIENLPSLANREIDYGIYQVYGRHFIYGDFVLLYIGQANQQTLATRITQQSYWFEEGYSIYIGRLGGSNTPSEDIWRDEIDCAERLLINIHTPPYNSSNINSLNWENLEHIHILNFGNYRSLLPEISGLRWITNYGGVDSDIYRLDDRLID